MTRPVCLQVYISPELSARVRENAQARGLNMSEWVRSLLATVCDGIDPGATTSLSRERIARHDVFVMVGVDALLAGHPDPELRDRAHQAFARKCRELGLAPVSDQGGDA